MGSSRLPGKVLVDIGGQPALTRLARRLKRCQYVDAIVLATSLAQGDNALESWAATEGVPIYRGSEDDVLARVVGAQAFMHSEIVVEITGDCVLTDPETIDLGVETFLENDCDVVTNVRKPSYPMGADVQVYRLSALREVERTVHDPAVREHVSLYFYEHPEQFRVLHLFAPKRLRGPEYRLQLDYPQDLEFIRQVVSKLEPHYGEGFGLGEIMTLLRNEPELTEINKGCAEKPAR